MTKFKLIALVLGILMSLLNISLDYDTFNFFDSSLSYNVSEARVAGFALVAAMFLFVGLFSTPNASSDQLFLDRFIQAIGAVAAGAAAWFALESAMGGKPWPYFALMGVFVGLIASGILFGAAIPVIGCRLKSLISRLKRRISCWNKS